MRHADAIELQYAGNMLGVKVTIVQIGCDLYRVNIRDLEFISSTRAALYLQHIAMTELPENVLHLVG